MKRNLLSILVALLPLVASADEYTDPQSKVVYTYEPGQSTASVKAGYDEIVEPDLGSELMIDWHSGSPDAAGDVVILDRFTVGTEEYVVTSIGDVAFRRNMNIKSVSIPETVTTIGNYAFNYCDSLTSVQLPYGLTQIAPGLFCGCEQLASVAIPSSVISIGERAFSECSSLSSISLPAGLTFIGSFAFNGTPWYNAQYNEAPDGLFYIGPQLVCYKGDKPTGNLAIKDGTTCVANSAFSNCTGLTSVTFPKTVTFVDTYAFENCTGLKAVHITDLAAWCGIEFKWSRSGSSNPLCYAYDLYLDGEKVSDIVIPEGVTRIGDYTFDHCGPLTSVVIPDGVTSIGENAFRSCISLTSVTIPPSIAKIGGQAFLWCKKLNSVHISDLAAWCRISFGYSSNPLCYNARLYLKGDEVTDLVIPDGVTRIGDHAFEKCPSLTSVTIPKGVSSIGNYAFRNCSNLCSIAIPEGVTSIGEYAFDGCSGFTSISLPKSLSSIGQSAFAHCGGLSNITIPEGVTSIGDFAFDNCSGLTNITIPPSLTNISHGAFNECTKLASITIPNSVTFVSGFAFGSCSNLADIYCYADNAPTTEYRVFYDTPIASATLHVPAGSVEKYKAASPWNEFGNIEALEAQNDSFLTEGLAWVDGFGYEQDGKYKTDDVKMFYYKAAGDTLISNKRYVRIRRAMKCKTSYKREEDAEGNGYISDKGLTVQNDTLCFFLREDGAGDVWLYTEDKNVFREVSHNSLYEYMADNLVGRDLFLFNPTKRYAVGDSLLLGMSALVDPNGFGGSEDFWHIYSSRVEKVNEINLSSSKTYPIYNNYFIESLGPLDGPLSGIGSPNSYNLDFRQLFAFYRDGRLIYKNEEYLAALEEYFPEIMDIITNSKPTKPVTFTKDQMATIILPTAPDASKGKYYRLDRCQDGQIFFEEEAQPRARVPYIIVPSEDFSIDPSTLDLEGLTQDTVSIDGISFIGSYKSEELKEKEGWYIDIIDTTPDCQAEEGKAYTIGALRAYLFVNWDDPINHPGSKGPDDKLEIVLKDKGTGVVQMVNDKSSNGKCYDLTGRKLFGKPERGIYIEDGKKKVMR